MAVTLRLELRHRNIPIAELFESDVKTIGKHINNALKEELSGDNSTVAKICDSSN
ncbi:hypothetical protein [Ruminococcus sp.]|uniref:hypothetical protein n=1 Tax=Ruminococcus sp. TaxID=41978 RepID=UPI0025E5D208|nr:hypothetical protein [Ruminococcus sp.]